ncbi:MAG: helix-turn-helix domain-containing protein [Epibacterium sp.]|nr:helix-turn-helix domain-containing protein [Epibacterium sp.]NQX74511.1 hypothetical protein [Epibacterium sp.]
MTRNKSISQPDLVMSYLKNKKTLNAIEAFGLFGITRLAAVIHRLRSRGINIVSIERDGIRGRYTEYMLSR